MELQDIYKLIETFNSSDLVKLELKHEDSELVLKRASADPVAMTQVAVPQVQPVHVEQVISPTAPAAPVAVPSGTAVNAPLVGVFYAAPAPGKANFVKVGDAVQKGQVLCVIEAMKTMNEIVAPIDGTIAEILVGNEDIVA